MTFAEFMDKIVGPTIGGAFAGGAIAGVAAIVWLLIAVIKRMSRSSTNDNRAGPASVDRQQNILASNEIESRPTLKRQNASDADAHDLTGPEMTREAVDRLDLSLRYGKGVQGQMNEVRIFGESYRRRFESLIRSGESPDVAFNDTRQSILSELRIGDDERYQHFSLFLQELFAANATAHHELTEAMKTLGDRFDADAATKELRSRHRVQLSDTAWTAWSSFLGESARDVSHQLKVCAALAHELRAAISAQDRREAVDKIIAYLNDIKGWSLMAYDEPMTKTCVQLSQSSSAFFNSTEELADFLENRIGTYL